MKVKRYTGNSLEKIKEVINNELGEHAVIISTKKIAGKGLLSSKDFEVIAAVEDAVDADAITANKVVIENEDFEEMMDIQKNQYRGLRMSMKMLDEKLIEVDEKIATLSLKSQNATAVRHDIHNIHGEWRLMIEKQLEKSKKSDVNAEDWHSGLSSLIKTAGGIMFRPTPNANPDVYVMTGPTGVGKTTTLAKLAAKCVLAENLKVGLITIDTFRVAAVDQLKEYASLLGVEVAVAFSAHEIESILERFIDKDIVFIDTPGRSQFDDEGIQHIKDAIKTKFGVCTLLVLPSNIRQEDAESTYDSYKKLKPAALILTKTDEASCCDGISKLLDISGLPVVYLTDGQRVPEDLHIATPGVIASMIIPEVRVDDSVALGEKKK